MRPNNHEPMKQKLRFMILALAIASLAISQKSPDALLGAALHQEEVLGDLKAAITAYQKVLASPGVSRNISSEALLRLASCHEKLGSSESRKAYERILREFSDQKAAVDQARMRLTTLNAGTLKTTGIVNRSVWMLPKGGDINGSGRISPDGRYLPFVNWDEFGNLFVRDLASNTTRRLTNDGNDGKVGVRPAEDQFAEEYTWSPDGQRLVYSWFSGKRYELRVINLQESGIPVPRTLFDNQDFDWVGPYNWSPDGKSIAVALQSKDKIAKIGLVSAVDGSLRVLKTVDWRAPKAMFFSPDGRSLAYNLRPSENALQRDIFVLSIDGSRDTPVVVHASDDPLLGWSPDGKQLLFASDRRGTMDLWSISFADGKAAGSPELLKRDVGISEGLGITSSGSLYYAVFNLPGGDVQLGTFDFGKGVFLSPPSLAVQSFVGSNSSPDWSPDGKSLAYFSRRRSVGSHYYAIGIRSESNGSTREILPSPNFTLLRNLSWSPDGSSLVVTGSTEAGRKGVHRIDSRSGSSSLLLESKQGEDIVSATYSADGKTLYYRLLDLGNGDMITKKRDLASGGEIELIRDKRKVQLLNLSPDGKYIALGGPVLQLISTANSAAQELLKPRQGQSISVQAWYPDSQSLLILLRDNEKATAETWRVPLSGTPERLGSADANIGGPFRVHPDGRQVAFRMAAPGKPGEIWVLENFLPARSANR